MMGKLPWRVLVALFVLSNLAVLGDEAETDVDRLSQQLPAAVKRQVDFERDVQPVFRDHCFECHSGDVAEGGLNLAVKSRAMRGGEQGAVLVPGDSLSSVLIHLIAGVDKDRVMPPEGERLSAEQVGILRAWIDQGAAWPQRADVLDPRVQRARQHWAFRRLSGVEPPRKQKDDTWSQTVIDLFIKEKLQANRLTPSDPATAEALVRRLYFDLVGLPPAPDLTRRFIASHQKQPRQAASGLVEELLNSPRYGERWARHWLDVARYADSDGQESDRDRPQAYRYRDFVIDAFNSDMPYDQFVRWQIAGDEFEPDNDAAVSATGFLTAGPSEKLGDTFLERERLFNRYNELDDMISTLGNGLLGLTVGCARCHDHKYDAFSAREYYQLLSIFHSGDRVSAKLPSGDEGFFFQDFDADVRTSWLFRRSDFYDREIEVSLGFPEILSDGHPADDYWVAAKQAVADPQSTLQRRALADWITDVEHGGGALLARVFVNRLWQHHFGRGLVETSSDFGVRGEAPTHPKLLEYLTQEFVRGGWRVKRLHGMILNSATWQQRSRSQEVETSFASVNRAEVDPQNRLLWKMMPQRLEAEALRDAMLAVSGTLNLQAGGPGFKPYIPPEANLARNIQGGEYPKDAKDDASTRRRGVYMFHKRLVPYPLFQAFDRPELMTSCSRRHNTTVAPQGLALLNDRFVRAVAGDFASRLLELHGDDDQQLVEASFTFSFARSPTERERKASLAFIRSQQDARERRSGANPRQEAVADYCQSLFGLNEFIYVD